MEKNKKIERLESMLGKKWDYNDSEFTLLTYRIAEDNVSIELITDNKEWIKGTILNLGVILDKFKEIATPALETEIMKSTITIPKDDLIDQVEKALLEDLQKVRKERDYIPQAKQSTETAKSIIEARKLRIDQAKFINKYS